LEDHEDREVEVTIEANEVEPIGLGERVAKIFDEYRLDAQGTSNNCADLFATMRDRVLAELDKEEQAK